METVNASGSTCWDHLWAAAKFGEELDDLARAMEEILVGLRESWTGAMVFEAGSGSGRISLRLSRRGARVRLLDISLEALRLASRHRSGLDAALIRGDLRQLPFADGTFDLSWNGGVLEHLSLREQDLAIAEMSRVTRRGGHVVSFNPNRASVPYRVGKRLMERNATWRYGYEEPIRSLAGLYAKHGLALEREFDIGVSHAFSFLPRMPRRLLRTIDRAKPVFRAVGMRGYIVVSVGRRI